MQHCRRHLTPCTLAKERVALMTKLQLFITNLDRLVCDELNMLAFSLRNRCCIICCIPFKRAESFHSEFAYVNHILYRFVSLLRRRQLSRSCAGAALSLLIAAGVGIVRDDGAKPWTRVGAISGYDDNKVQSCSATQRVQLLVASDIMFSVHTERVSDMRVRALRLARLFTTTRHQRHPLMKNATRKSICLYPARTCRRN
jgi:hypothetical protein